MDLGLGAKFDELTQVVKDVSEEAILGSHRGVLLLYPPEEELAFRELLNEWLLHISVQQIPHRVLDLATLPFEFLESRGQLERSFRMEFENWSGLRQHLGRLNGFLKERVLAVGTELGWGNIVLKSTASLYPWVSYAALLEQIPTGFPCRVVIPFPGTAQEGKLHFLDRKTGYNYLARRV